MRFWFSLPFIGRTRIGVSVSDREIAQALNPKPLTAKEARAAIERKAAELEQRAARQAEWDAYAKATADKWAPFVVDAIMVTAIVAVVFVIWWAVMWLVATLI